MNTFFVQNRRNIARTLLNPAESFFNLSLHFIDLQLIEPNNWTSKSVRIDNLEFLSTDNPVTPTL